MVATRRGVRVCSPSKSNQESSSDVQATPCTSRRTRSTARKAENPNQHGLIDNCSQLEKVETEHPTSPPSSSVKRCTRASRLHSPEQPCTPVGSSHEGDISDVESCCSALSDIEPPRTGTTGRIRQSCFSPEDEDISEVESCSSAVSPSRACQGSRRSSRRRKTDNESDAPLAAAKVDLALEAEPTNSVPSESKRVTRSQRRTTRSSAKQQTDSELSDTDSQLSSVSGLDVSKSTSRRATRSRTQVGPIPIHLDEATESSLSPAPTRRSSRTARGKASVVVDVSESQSCDSEGFESSSTHGRRNLRRVKAKSMDSDSEPTNVHSPLGSSCSTRSRGTPCSSRSGSCNSKQGTLSFRHSTKHLTIVLEKTEEPAKEHPSLNDSMLESTIIAEDADCTLLEENVSQSLEERENYSVNRTDSITDEMDTVRMEKGVRVISEEGSHVSDRSLLDSSGCAQEPVSTPAVSVRDQQEELCDENKDGDTSDMEVMQETVYSSEPINNCQSVALTSSERTSEATEESGEKDKSTKEADVDGHLPQRDEGAAVKICPSEEEKMEVSTFNSDKEEAQQVVNSSEVQVETIQITSSQQRKITMDSLPEEQPENVIVKSKNVISLLESSEDEEEEKQNSEEEEKSNSEEEDLGCLAEDRGGPPEAAGTSGGGLFMIDTRPGQDADEDYYLEKAKEEQVKASKEEREGQQEEDEEFVDEEGDDDDDEDANLLFSCRNPLLKKMSSRIDPGIRMKELGGLYINFDGSKSKPVSSSLKKIKEKKIQDEVMKKSVMGPDFEKKDTVPPYSESKQASKLKHRVEREKSTGDGWFNMKAPEITQELKGDLQVLKMRGSLDPKRFYKKNDRDGFPKYFQVGTVVDNPVDFYHSRIPKKQRKRNMVEELLADAEFRHNNKRKFQQIIAEKAAQKAGKKNKKKNKFNKK